MSHAELNLTDDEQAYINGCLTIASSWRSLETKPARVALMMPGYPGARPLVRACGIAILSQEKWSSTSTVEGFR